MLIPYWNTANKPTTIEAYPDCFDSWAHGQELSADRQGLHEAAEKILNRTVVKVICREESMNLTLEAFFDDDDSVFVRRRLVFDAEDPSSNEWSFLKYQTEIDLLCWLKKKTRIPIPAVLAVGHSTYDFSIQEKMPGSVVARQWHLLSSSQKENFLSQYADHMIELFRIPVPQRIGSVAFESVGGTRTVNVQPRIGKNLLESCTQIFDDIFQYMIFFVDVKRKSIQTSEMTSEEQERAERTLIAVESVIPSLVERIKDPALLRCVLTHGDLHALNILINANGDITAILDWEFTYIQPAILGVQPVAWLNDEGTNDPQFAYEGELWIDSPCNRRKFGAMFGAMVRERDEEYYNCMREGKDMKALVEWLTDKLNDPGFERMGKWASCKLGVTVP